MRNASLYKAIGMLILPVLFTASCQNKFLDEKPNSSLVVPETLEDFQRLLDNFGEINATPILGEVSADDYYLNDQSVLDAQMVEFRNAYLWKPDIFEGKENIRDWNWTYNQVFVANIVLEGLQKLERTATNAQVWDQTKGWALFVRAHAFFNLAQLFAPVYDENTAQTDLGIPIRLNSGVDEASNRSSVKETYERIIEDLTNATELLPSTLPIPNRNRASKPAALGLLARVYLNTRKYDMALAYSERCLSIYNVLINYNNVLGLIPPFEFNDEEVIYQSEMGQGVTIFSANSSITSIDSTLLSSYQENDLRKQTYFRLVSDKYRIYWSYLGGKAGRFGGIATDEIYLIKAECLARNGQLQEAMDTLNILWRNRADDLQDFIPFKAGTAEETLKIVLSERRKELIYRGLRWQDLRRLNKEGFNILIKRNIEGKEYGLAPNSPLYVLPIPPDEIRLSGLQQNIR